MTSQPGTRLTRWTDLVADQTLGGWLVADFRWNNPLFSRLLGLSGGTLTRRAFLWLPARGEPAVMASRVDGHTVAGLDANVILYAGFEDMVEHLRRLLPSTGRIAMEYVERGALPAISRVDAGLAELIRSLGVEIVSSGDLIAAMDVWDERQQKLHLQAACGVDEARRLVLERCAELLGRGEPVSEGAVADLIIRAFADRGLEAGHRPDVGVGPNSADPHYAIGDGPGAPIERDRVLLIDLATKLRDVSDAPYADSTWMSFTGRTPPERYRRAFETVRAARDAAISAIDDAMRAGRTMAGREADAAARNVIAAAGQTDRIMHRTGHSLGTDHVHGIGTNLDGIEFPDGRPLITGSGFTVEPGLYWPGEFGVRMEVSAILTPTGLQITTERQQEITLLG